MKISIRGFMHSRFDHMTVTRLTSKPNKGDISTVLFQAQLGKAVQLSLLHERIQQLLLAIRTAKSNREVLIIHFAAFRELRRRSGQRTCTNGKGEQSRVFDEFEGKFR